MPSIGPPPPKKPPYKPTSCSLLRTILPEQRQPSSSCLFPNKSHVWGLLPTVRILPFGTATLYRGSLPPQSCSPSHISVSNPIVLMAHQVPILCSVMGFLAAVSICVLWVSSGKGLSNNPCALWQGYMYSACPNCSCSLWTLYQTCRFRFGHPVKQLLLPVRFARKGSYLLRAKGKLLQTQEGVQHCGFLSTTPVVLRVAHHLLRESSRPLEST